MRIGERSDMIAACLRSSIQVCIIYCSYLKPHLVGFPGAQGKKFIVIIESYNV